MNENVKQLTESQIHDVALVAAEAARQVAIDKVGLPDKAAAAVTAAYIEARRALSVGCA